MTRIASLGQPRAGTGRPLEVEWPYVILDIELELETIPLAKIRGSASQDGERWAPLPTRTERDSAGRTETTYSTAETWINEQNRAVYDLELKIESEGRGTRRKPELRPAERSG